MNCTYRNLTIRNANAKDCSLLATWWNDGSVMAHAGFPYGLNTNSNEIENQIANDSDETKRRLILERDNKPIGEMSFTVQQKTIVEIGIKICDVHEQNKGLGKLFLSMLITELYKNKKITKIILDTNLENKRAQHVYETLGFKKICTKYDSWTDQLGNKQSVVDYELLRDDFISFLKD